MPKDKTLLIHMISRVPAVANFYETRIVTFTVQITAGDYSV